MRSRGICQLVKLNTFIFLGVYARVSAYKQWIDEKIAACGGDAPDADKCGYDKAGYEAAQKVKANEKQDTNDVDIASDGDFNMEFTTY